jgi:murein DD-endopeptidase MepM/ murein hydrolase activator NlpD
VLLVSAALFLWPIVEHVIRELPAILFQRSPHARYVGELHRRGVHDTPRGRQWLADADQSLSAADELPVVFARTIRVGPADATARAWRFQARRGQRLLIDAPAGGRTVFIDLFRAEDGSRLASAPAGSVRLSHVVGADEPLLARVQLRLGEHASIRLVQRAEATLRFPVEGATPRAVGSVFGASRDRGARRHEGIDIFAPRGTPVVAAADGWITAQTSNRLGGTVVWLWSIEDRISLYYAHLDRRTVSPGEWVRAGEVVGYVGNTGNARGTAPHLHFGVYAPPSGAVDPLPFVCDAPCGERVMHPQRRRRVGRQVENDS